MTLYWAFLGALGASIAVPIVFALFARLFPASKASTAGASLEELQPRYQKWERRLNFLYLLLCVPITLALWTCLRWLCAWHAMLLPPASITLTAMPIYWLIPAMFLSMLCAAPVATRLSKRILKGKYEELERYQALRYGFDQERVARLIVVVVGLFCTIGIFQGLNWYVLVTDQEIVIHGLLAVNEERHPINSIRRIRTAPKLIAPLGNVVSRREYVVDFSPEGSWSTDSLPADLGNGEKRALIQRLSDRSGVAIQEVGLFRKGEL